MYVNDSDEPRGTLAYVDNFPAEAAAELDALRARVAELEADAARYRWLRGKVCIIGTPHLSYQKAIFEFVNLPYPPRVAHDPSAELDAAIDAARLSGNKSKVRK